MNFIVFILNNIIYDRIKYVINGKNFQFSVYIELKLSMFQEVITNTNYLMS